MEKLKLKHGRDYFSPSQLKKLTVSLGAFNSYLNKARYSSSAMDLGTLVHTLFLERDKFDERYFILDDSDIIKEIGGARPTSTKKYSEWKDIQTQLAEGRELISNSLLETAEGIYDRACMLGVIDSFFTDGEAEKTIRGEVTDFDTPFDALAIIDYDAPFNSVDLKTTSKPLDKFKWDADTFGYDIQARLTQAMNGKEFIFVVVQTVEPYDIGVFTTSEYFLDRGKDKINKALANYEFYEDNYSSQILSFEL